MYKLNARITTHKYIIVLRVTILDGREGGLSSRVGLIRKSTDITRVIAIGPLELFQKKMKQARKGSFTMPSRLAPYPARPFCPEVINKWANAVRNLST